LRLFKSKLNSVYNIIFSSLALLSTKTILMKFFDAHFHIIDPDFPLVENQGYLPPAFSTETYLQETEAFEWVGGAIVSGSFQAFDSEYLVKAINKLGTNYVGVANIPADITEADLKRLHAAGVVAVRFNLNRGVADDPAQMVRLSNQLFQQYGWHTELYIDSRFLRDWAPCLSALAPFSIDHLGLSKEGLDDLYYWVEKGAKIKATGFGRIDFDPVPVMKKIYSINPEALLFGTDLPSTRAKIPFSYADIQLVRDNFSEVEQENIFYKNAQAWYL